jgi:sugar (pentulose or hexulose) kinase
MWNKSLGGLPAEEFLTAVDPLLAGVGDKLAGRYATSDQIAGKLSPEWAAKLGLRAGIPIPVGAFDAHWDAIGAGVREGDVVNVIGTSTCIMAIARETKLIPGVCRVPSIRGWRGLKPGSRPRVTFSMRSPAARALQWRRCRKGLKHTGQGRRDCSV